MSSKTKHSKIRNTGILFELLTRQITVDVLNNDKKGSAANILKEFFNKNTQLGKEYELYRVLTVENYKSETKANHLVDAVIKARQKLNESSLKREKYNLIKEVRSNYDINDFFMARIPNYKVNASIYKLFSIKEPTTPKVETESRFTIIEKITRKSNSAKKKEDVEKYGDDAWVQLGVIAQELESAGMDKCVKQENFYSEEAAEVQQGKANAGDIKEYKSVKYSILYMKAIKALQEAMTRIETLEAEVTALKG